MKSLSDYTEQAQTKLFDECGVFFAFSKKQFEEGCEKVGASADNKVMSFGAGGYLLSKNYDVFEAGMEQIQAEGIKQDIEENGLEGIIQRELANYEVQITGDWKQLLETLEDYKGITEEMVYEQFKIFMKLCVDNDWF
jgi:hypothetical protein